MDLYRGGDSFAEYWNDCIGIYPGMADGIHPGISRNHEPVPHANVVIVGIDFSCGKRCGLVALDHETQPVNLRSAVTEDGDGSGSYRDDLLATKLFLVRFGNLCRFFDHPCWHWVADCKWA